MAKFLDMSILSRLKLRGRLLAGFLACAALAAISGGIGIVSLRQIQRGTQATGDQITELIDQQGAQGRWFRALRRVVSSITTAENEEMLAAARKHFQELQDTVAGADQQTAGVLRAVDQLLHQRSEELVAAAALAASSRKAENLLKDLTEAAKTAADSAQFQVNGRMKETVGAIKIASDKAPQALGKDLDRLSEETGTVISTVKAALSVRNHGQELNIHVKDALLADDPAVVEYARSKIATLLSDATGEVAKLPEVEGKDTLSKAFEGLRGPVTKMIDLRGRAFSDKKTKNGSKDDLDKVEGKDTLSKAFEGLRGLVTKIIDLRGQAFSEKKTKNGSQDDLDKIVRSICETLNKIDGTTLAIVDTLQFDSSLAMDEVLKDIKKRASGSAAENSGRMATLVTSTDGGLSTIKAAVAVRANCHQLNILTKDAMQANDPAVVDQSRRTLSTLIGTVKQDIALLSIDGRSVANVPNLDTLHRLIGDEFDARKHILSAERKLNEASEQVARELAALDEAMVTKAEGVKTSAEQTKHTTEKLIGRWQAVQLVLGIGTVLLALIVGTVSATAITRPLKRVASMLEDIAQGAGDLSRRLQAARQVVDPARGICGIARGSPPNRRRRPPPSQLTCPSLLLADC